MTSGGKNPLLSIKLKHSIPLVLAYDFDERHELLKCSNPNGKTQGGPRGIQYCLDRGIFNCIAILLYLFIYFYFTGIRMIFGEHGEGEGFWDTQCVDELKGFISQAFRDIDANWSLTVTGCQCRVQIPGMLQH